ncbi:Uncharacterised protein [Mycobacteroides abscessus subsp. bolletii]|nr:Uncharacterised protein [Mycobacteroides abscessus subsp. bolletii]
MTDNPICICTHPRSDHADRRPRGNPNPRCGAGTWVTTAEVPRGDNFQVYEPCDCPGYEADPNANGDNQ